MWKPIETAPTDGTRFDAWAVEPKTKSFGVRFCNVSMRGDKTGFGTVLPDGKWEYIGREQFGPTYPAWVLTHWMPIPGTPAIDRTLVALRNAEDFIVNSADKDEDPEHWEILKLVREAIGDVVAGNSADPQNWKERYLRAEMQISMVRRALTKSSLSADEKVQDALTVIGR